MEDVVLFLEPEAAMVSANAPAHEQENNYAFTDKQVKKVLWEAGRLKSTEPDKNTLRKMK
ncbi:uncharacterized protein METZ01_LOCUS512214 [marine metagenome]|uniref:Uncharacterized protein n=1 Tax=marine metagenome TaxID=408172 RepID=A0A383ESS4_9ZZZZ